MKPIKYYDPNNPENLDYIWTGIGRKPAWIFEHLKTEGNSLEQLEVKPGNPFYGRSEEEYRAIVGEDAEDEMPIDIDVYADIETRQDDREITSAIKSIVKDKRGEKSNRTSMSDLSDEGQESNVASMRHLENGPTFGKSEENLAIARNLGDSLVMPVEERFEEAVFSINRAEASYMDAGLLLLSIKGDLPHGDFRPFIEKRGIGKDKAWRLMSAASFIANSSESDQKKLLGMGVTKVALISNADTEVLSAVEENEQIDLTKLSVTALKKELKDAKTRIDAQAEHIKNANHRADKAEQAKNYETLASETDMPKHVVRARIETQALQLQASVALENLRKDWLSYADLEMSSDEESNGLKITRAYYFSAVQLAHAAQDLIKSIETLSAPEHISQLPTTADWPQKPEQAAINEAANEIISTHIKKWDARQATLSNKYKTQGRPFKVDE